MKGIKALLQGIAVAAYTSGWWAVGVFGPEYDSVYLCLIPLVAATIVCTALGICWFVWHRND